MKKIISLVIAAMMAVSMLAVSAIPAMADETVSVLSPNATTTKAAATLQVDKVQLQVNGENRQGVTYKQSTTNANEVTFVYNGEGTLTGWEENLATLGLVEGTDYTKVINADGSLTITFITEKAITDYNSGSVIVNALVDFGTTTTAAETTTEEEEEGEEEEETTTSAAKKNTSSKSPSTGMSTAAVAGVVALAGAGYAVLKASKKDED